MNWFKKFWKAKIKPGLQSDATAGTLPNLTPRAQQVLALARQEANRINHNFVGTEHLLLGLIKLGKGVAVNVLQKEGLNLQTVRAEVEKQVGTGPNRKMIGNPPYTPRVKKVLALAEEERRKLNHTYLGTEHILLGLLLEGDGVAARVMRNLGMDIEQTRREILQELDPNFSPDETKNSEVPTATPPRSEMPPKPEPARPKPDPIDTSKRYDVYCTEGNEGVVVYRNALFKGVKRLYQMDQFDRMAQFLELEQADRQTVFLARSSVVKFCEHGVTPNAEVIPTKKLPG